MHSDRILIIAMALVVLAVGAGLVSLDQGTRNFMVDLLGYGGRHSDEDVGIRDLFHSGASIRGAKQGETYSVFDQRRDRMTTEGFEGFGCLETCAELEAGYRWGEAQNVDDPGECRGEDWSFVEGCVAFATRNEAVEP